jgi:hypothetical protein
VNNLSNQKQIFFKALIIHMSFFLSVFMYVFIVNFLNLLNKKTIENIDFIFYVLVAVSIAEIISLPFVKLLIKNNFPNKNKLQTTLIAHIVVCILAEMPAVFAFILAFLGSSNLYFYTLIALSLFGLIICFPKQSQFNIDNSTDPD